MWLLVGGDFEIGAATHQFLKSRGIASAATTRRRERLAADRPFLDLALPLDTWKPPAGTTAACIFAAVARITACDADPRGSSYINVTQTVALADRLLARDIPVLYLSTNQVFDGTVANVAADAAPNPVTEYGRQKAAAEAAFRARMETGPACISMATGRTHAPPASALPARIVRDRSAEATGDQHCGRRGLDEVVRMQT